MVLVNCSYEHFSEVMMNVIDLKFGNGLTSSAREED